MDSLGKSVQRVTTSSNVLSAVSAEQDRKNILAAERTQLMLDCFRTGAANNPEVFVTAIAATLARYPDQVIYDVTDPRTGIPSKISWMPTIKDVREACERAYGPIKEDVEREKRIAEQMRLREEYESKSRPTYDDLKAKYGKDWGIGRVNGTEERVWAPAPNAAEIRAHYRKYNLQFRPKTELEEHIDAGFSPSTV